jgi:hypothetical protein
MRDSALPGAALGYLRQALPPPGRHRIYLDRGTTDLEALYAPHLPAAEALLRERGYGAGDALTRVFDGTGHNERDWAARVEIPLAFLLGPR